MLLPQEIEVWYVIPAIRKELAEILLKKGLKQKEVAKLMYVTPSAINQYFKNKRAKEIVFNKAIKKEIQASANKLIQKKTCSILEIEKICKILEKTGFIIFLQKKFNERCKKCKYI